MSQSEKRPGSFAELVRAFRTSSSQTTQARTLLGAIAEEQPGEMRRRRWRLSGVVAVTLAGLAGFAIVWWVAVQAALYGWQTTNWDPSQTAELALPFLGFTVLALPILSLFRLPLGSREIRRILDAIAVGDQRVVALVTPQPEPLPSPELAPGPESFRRLRALPSWSEDRNFLPLLLILVQPSGFAFQFLQSAFDEGLAVSLFGVPIRNVIAGVAVLSIASYLLALILLIPGSGRWRVTADDFGMTWQRKRSRRGQAHVPWGSVRSFFAHESYSPFRTTYVLTTDNAVLGWALTSNSKADENAESERLVRLIVTHTRLPLRYLSLRAPSAAQAQEQVALPHGPGLETDLLADLARMQRRPIRRVLRGLAVTLPLALLIFFGTQGASSRLQGYQQTYFVRLPAQIHAETPLFQDPLSYDDGNWLVEKPSASDNEASYAFVDGAYQLTGRTGQFVDSPIAPVYSDAAVEVTARQIGQAPQSGHDGVGLVVRLDGDQGMVAFYVSPTDGSWTLAHYRYNADNPDYSWEYMGYGTSSAIQRGDEAVNRLLVLMRGSTFLLYVNDHFIDSFTDRYHEIHNLLSAGQIGVYLNEGATIAIFSDFAVYPVQSPPSLSYA